MGHLFTCGTSRESPYWTQGTYLSVSEGIDGGHLKASNASECYYNHKRYFESIEATLR